MELTLQSALSAAAFPGHASYFLVVLAMLMSSILALRLLALASGAAGLVYSAMILADPVGVFWEIAFIAANATQLTLMESPDLAPLNLNEMNGFFEIALPHCALRTVFPPDSQTTSWINSAGIGLPDFLSLRRPVSIGWLIRALTVAVPSLAFALSLIDFAMFVITSNLLVD